MPDSFGGRALADAVQFACVQVRGGVGMILRGLVVFMTSCHLLPGFFQAERTFTDLCRYRHKSVYTDKIVMPTNRTASLVNSALR